jgi:hypothetical protein
LATICYGNRAAVKLNLQAIPLWRRYAREFVPDGSLRNILILDTAESDWREAMAFLAAQSYEFRFQGKWTGNRFPRSTAVLFPSARNEELTLLSVNISGVIVNCHFFAVARIQFDLDPREVTDGRRLAGLFAFMQGLANAVRKEVRMAPDGVPEHPIFTCRPNDTRIDYQPFFSGPKDTMSRHR